jgi:hypothetical protein
MNPIAPLAIVTALALASCANLDPEYAEYKKQKEAEAAGQAGLGGAADPYGAGTANPYGVPGQGSDVGTYTPQTPAPYQPLPAADPNASADPYAANPRAGAYPTIPGPAAGGTGGPTAPHVVAKGDSIWGLSQKYGVSQNAIRQANGLTSDTIVIGTTLQIPRN